MTNPPFAPASASDRPTTAAATDDQPAVVALVLLLLAGEVSGSVALVGGLSLLIRAVPGWTTIVLVPEVLGF